MSKCRGCGKEIRWIKTVAGRSMPCDLEPQNFDLTTLGNEVFVTANGEVQKGSWNPSGDYTGYISHFATCPAADKFRRS